MRFLVFFGVAVLVVVAIHAYLGLQLIAATSMPQPWRTMAWVALAASPVLVVGAFIGPRIAPSSRALAVLEWAGYLAIGVVMTVFPLLAARDLLSLALSTEVLRAGASGAVLAGGGLALSAAGLAQARLRPGVKRVEIAIADLPRELEGFRIVQITDLHVSTMLRRPWVERVVAAVNALSPDLIAVTGDLVDGRVDELVEDVEPLRELRARHGTFFVTGNHEYYWGPREWVRKARELGMTVLLNEHRVLEVDGAPLVVAGVTDHHAGSIVPEHRSDPRAAAEGAPEDAPRILLAHQPVSLRAAADVGYDLQLSGHTHGGQFFPWNLVIYGFQPVVSGLKRFGRLQVYVSRGTGTWGPPLRTGVPSEITELTLTRARTRSSPPPGP